MSVAKVIGEGEVRYVRIIALLLSFIFGGGGMLAANGTLLGAQSKVPAVSRELFDAAQAEQAAMKMDIALLKQALATTVQKLDHITEQIDRLIARP